MKSIINFYDKLPNRPFFKFCLNIFPIKYNSYFTLKQLKYIHIFCNVKKLFKIKIFKFNYHFLNTMIFYFIMFNLLIQVLLIIFF